MAETPRTDLPGGGLPRIPLSVLDLAIVAEGSEPGDALLAVVCASDDERARWLAGPARLSFARLRSGRPTRFPTPEEAEAHKFSAQEEASVKTVSGSAILGGPEKVRDGLVEFAERTRADELMLTTMVHAQADRLRSYELVAEAMEMEPLPAAKGVPA